MNSANTMKAIFLTAATLICAVGCGLWPGRSDVPSDPIDLAIRSEPKEWSDAS